MRLERECVNRTGMQVFVAQVNIAFNKKFGFVKWQWPIARFCLSLSQLNLTWLDWTGLYSALVAFHNSWLPPQCGWSHQSMATRKSLGVIHYGTVFISLSGFSLFFFLGTFFNDLLVAGQSVVLPLIFLLQLVVWPQLLFTCHVSRPLRRIKTHSVAFCFELAHLDPRPRNY